MSWKQAERQRTRVRGRYSVMNRCEACGKSTGADYCSDPRLCNQGYGLVLCRKCHDKGTAMSEDAAKAFYSGGIA